MAARSYGVLVHYPDGSSDVRVVLETPVMGALLVLAEGSARWVAEDVRINEGEFGGTPHSFEVWVVAALVE
jgi:hypothetical protein